MSTQEAHSIRLTHSSHQRAFRLLELTPEIAELLSSSDNASASTPIFHLKSPPPKSSAKDTGYVNLCTADKTFRVRQVQSSNSIHLLQPTTGENSRFIPLKQDQNSSNDDDDDDDDDDDVESREWADTLSTIAKCASTLEVHRIDEGSASSVAQTLAQSLRIYDDDDQQDEDINMADHETQRRDSSAALITRAEHEDTKRQIFADVPFSEKECNAAWIDICAFVHIDPVTDGPAAFRPSARVKITSWKRILEGSVLQSIDLEKQFLANDLWKAVLGGEDGDEEEQPPFPRPLFDALLNRLVERPNGSQSVDLKWSNLDKEASVKWIGEMYLAAFAPTERSSIGRSDFLRAWKDLLPEAWRGEASMDALPANSYKFPDPVSICFVKESERHTLKKAADGGTGAGAAAAKNSRNWHERFGSQRK